MQNRNKARIKKHIRIRNKISGTKEVPRVTVFKSLNNLEAQLVNDKLGKTLAFASTKKLEVKNGGNIEAATKLGEEFGDKLKKLKVSKVVFDRSGYIYHGRVKAFADALREKGVQF